MALLGVVSLVVFAVALTRVDSAFAGRAYAAYRGICIAASLVWLWLTEGQRPSPTDHIGAAIAIAGALLIIGFAPKTVSTAALADEPSGAATRVPTGCSSTSSSSARRRSR